jgi:hypothetical protein
MYSADRPYRQLRTLAIRCRHLQQSIVEYHIDRIASKANRSLGFVKRNIKVKSPNVRECAYKTLVRPQLDYTSTILDPYTQTNIDKLDRVQKRAASWTTSDYSHYSSVTDMIQSLAVVLCLQVAHSIVLWCEGRINNCSSQP